MGSKRQICRPDPTLALANIDSKIMKYVRALILRAPWSMITSFTLTITWLQEGGFLWVYTIRIITDLHDPFRRAKITDAIFVDFAMAFDTEPH